MPDVVRKRTDVTENVSTIRDPGENRRNEDFCGAICEYDVSVGNTDDLKWLLLLTIENLCSLKRCFYIFYIYCYRYRCYKL